jgi:hypothetical protein
MRSRSLPLAAATGALVLIACHKGSQADILVGTTGTTSYAVAVCTVRDAQGRCIQATCKADEKSDCTLFADICLEYDFHYSGTKDSGTCNIVL